MNDAQNYFQATEIRTMISLLQLIDNPYQDIPLAAVLRSPIVGLIEPELASIRLANRAHTYYDAVLAYQASNEDELAAKLEHFGKQLEHWRELARRSSITDLLWDIYYETGYLEYVVGLPAGHRDKPIFMHWLIVPKLTSKVLSEDYTSSCVSLKKCKKKIKT